MHPDMVFELTKFRIEELHKEAARQRLGERPEPDQDSPTSFKRLGPRRLWGTALEDRIAGRRRRPSRYKNMWLSGPETEGSSQ